MSIPDWISVILVAAMPISELRGAIPVAMMYGFDPWTAYILSVIGNLIPVIPLLLWLEPVSNKLRRYNSWDRFFDWLFKRTHRRHSEYFEKYGTIALSLFVAIPLPVTGAWTGCAAAFVFGIKFRHAFPAIILGVMVAGVIVALTSLGFFTF
ncbi:MAG: small multi-drug export protein [Methanocellales archaeon]|nr:small multi-drug export protein [Methanocellales archaeon]